MATSTRPATKKSRSTTSCGKPLSERARAHEPPVVAHNQSVRSFAPFPAVAAWRHVGVRDGFEVASFERTTHGWLVRGMTAALEGSEAWAVHYEIKVNEQWLTQSAHVVNVSSGGEHTVTLNPWGTQIHRAREYGDLAPRPPS